MAYEYTVSWTKEDGDEESTSFASSITGKRSDHYGPVSLISFPAALAAEAALAMMAIRLSVMYHPSMRVTWGRYTKEGPLTRGLACGYVLMEIALWSTAAAQGIQRY